MGGLPSVYRHNDPSGQLRVQTPNAVRRVPLGAGLQAPRGSELSAPRVWIDGIIPVHHTGWSVIIVAEVEEEDPPRGHRTARGFPARALGARREDTLGEDPRDFGLRTSDRSRHQLSLLVWLDRGPAGPTTPRSSSSGLARGRQLQRGQLPRFCISGLRKSCRTTTTSPATGRAVCAIRTPGGHRSEPGSVRRPLLQGTTSDAVF